MNRIRELRMEKGWRGQDLADRLHVKKNSVSRYEREEHQLDPALICDLCDIFGCTADYLLGRSDVRWPTVTAEQSAFLRAYDALPVEIRRAVDGLMAPYLAQDNKKETA